MRTFLPRYGAAILLATLLLSWAPFSLHADTCVNGQTLDANGNVTGTCSADTAPAQVSDTGTPAATPASLTTGDTPPTPESVSAPYQYKNDGIFGCNQTGAAAMSVGTLSAIGGVYVPVNDASVTLNTGTLVYLECALRPLVDRLRESTTSGLFKKAVTGIETSRNGNPQYSVNAPQEDNDVRLKSIYVSLTDSTLDGIKDPQLKTAIRTSIARAELAPPDLTCPYQGDMRAGIMGQSNDVFGVLFAEANPDACIPLYNRIKAQDIIDARAALAVSYNQEDRTLGRNFYSVTDNAADPLAQRTLTPGSVVQESFQQILGSPLRQQESANDIGQMIGALFAGVTTQITTDNQGLAGIMQSVAGQPSYLDQVAKESSGGVIGAATNAALSILNASLQAETSYLTSMNSIASSLTDTINKLRSTEKQCWALIIPKAQAYAAQGTCTNPSDPTTCSGNFTLDQKKIDAATSSLAFSQQVIDSQIAPLVPAVTANITTSQNALQLINQLIAGVTNTGSLDAQRISLQQLDSLVAQKALHTQYDAQNASEQLKSTQAAMSGLITDTAQAWGDSPDPNVGWCNINNPTVIQMWADKWKK